MKIYKAIFIFCVVVFNSCIHSNKMVDSDFNPRKQWVEEHELMLKGLSNNHPSRLHYEKFGLDSVIFTIYISDSTYWGNVTPLMFVDTLAKYYDGFKFVLEVSPKQDWMNKKSTKELQSLIFDTTVCATVEKLLLIPPEVSPVFDSNRRTKCRTTIAQEVKFMLSCFETGEYPKVYSSCFYLDKD